MIKEPAQPGNLQQGKVTALRFSLKRIWNTLSTLFVVIVLILAAGLSALRLLGFTPYAVLSPSMSPSYDVGDLIYVKKSSFSGIKPGDAVTFVANEELTVVTHRVVEIDRENRRFYTKGDANEHRDAAPVLYENVLGVVKFSLPGLGYVSSRVSSLPGRIIAAGVITALLAVLILPEAGKKKRSKIRN